MRMAGDEYSGICFCFGALDVDCLTKCYVNLFDRRLDGLWFLCVFFSVCLEGAKVRGGTSVLVGGM